MRDTFIKTLQELAATDDRIVLLTGDLGYMVVEPFAEQFPDRFFNVGVAEQNMIGVATGLAEAGFIPFVYSIVCFAVLRPYEFLRNGPIYHQLPVRLVGIGGGFEYGNNGATHYGLEDIGVLRGQPGIQVIAPADSRQARAALNATWNLPGPIYYRLGKDDKAIVEGLNGRFDLDRVEIVRSGEHLLFLTLGNIVLQALEAAETLSRLGIETTVAVVPCLNPAPADDLFEILKRFALVFSVEAHFINGGLGSLIAEIIAERDVRTRLVRCGVRSVPDGISGSSDYLYEKNGISGDALARAARFEMGRKERE